MTRFIDQLRQGIDRVVPPQARMVSDLALCPADLGVLICRAMLHPGVDPKTKAALVCSGLYTASGLDLVPEAIFGLPGLVDDGVVVLTALDLLVNRTDPLILRELWPSSPEALARVQHGVGWLRLNVQERVVKPLARWLRGAIQQVVEGAL